MALEVRGHVGVEGGALLVVERRPERERGAEVGAEELPHLGAVVAQVARVELLEAELERVAEHRLDIAFLGPLERRSGAGRWWRHVRRHRSEHLADTARLAPGGEAEAAA